MTTSLLDASVHELVQALRLRTVSPVEVVDTHIQRIEEVNGAVNALVGERFEAARDEARQAEHQIMQGAPDALPPLLGVPCTVKEFIGIRGLPQTAGVYANRHRLAPRDGTAAARLRRAGAIVLGISNVPEGGFWMETHNLIFGRTRNPWDLRRTPGGSSGGEGALIGAGASPFGLGSDIGGSIRIPAAFCGIAGHKPTGRLVPNTGHFPGTDDPVNTFLTIGPMARRASDLGLLMRVIAGPDGEDPHTRTWTPVEPEKVDLRQLRIFHVANPPGPYVWPHMRQAVLQATEALRDAGARTESLEIPELRKAVQIWAAMMQQHSTQSYDDILNDGKPIPVLRELAKSALGRGQHTRPALLFRMIESLAGRASGRRSAWIDAGKRLEAQLESRLGSNGVMIYPSYTRVAPRHHWPLVTPMDAGCTCIFNPFEFPATVVPVGFHPNGLPISVQVIGARGSDHLTIAVAMAIERAFGGWKRANPPVHPARPLASQSPAPSG